MFIVKPNVTVCPKVFILVSKLYELYIEYKCNVYPKKYKIWVTQHIFL